jgi:enoyl-CoA hydratase
MTAAAHTRTEAHEGILSFTLTRDAKRNALSEAMLADLASAVEQLATSPALRVMLIRADGAYFSAGIDIGEMPDFRGVPGSSFRYRYRHRHQMLWDELETVEKPIVVAHQGPCLGGGLEMSLSCDFRLASERASYRLPEIGLGAIPGSGGISRLTRLVGPGWTRWLAMAGQPVDAHEALRIGLVHRVLPAAGFAEACLAFCGELAALPAEALAAAKLAIDAIDPLDRESARQIERLATSGLATGEEYQRQLEAFRNKRRGPDDA